MKSIKNWIITVWKDPVWSKVIATIIIAGSAFIWAKTQNKSILDLYYLSLNILSFTVPIYFLLSLLGTLILIKYILRFFKKKPDPIGDEIIGNYTFKELFMILSNEKIKHSNRGMQFSGMKPPDIDLLNQFYNYAPLLNMGIGIDGNHGDAGFLWGVFCPKIMTYGLVEKIETIDPELSLPDIKYQTSENGYKFLALIERHELRKKKI